MGTATILGDTYQTVVMPDGKEWVNKFRYDALGRWLLDDSGYPNALEFGKYYTYTERDTIAGLLTDGWRIPTADDFTGLFASTAPASLCGTGTTYWILGQGTDDYGFTQQAGGFCNSVGFYHSQITWWAPASEAYIWGAAVGSLTGLLVLDGDNPTLVATQSVYDPSGIRRVAIICGLSGLLQSSPQSIVQSPYHTITASLWIGIPHWTAPPSASMMARPTITSSRRLPCASLLPSWRVGSRLGG